MQTYKIVNKTIDQSLKGEDVSIVLKYFDKAG